MTAPPPAGDRRRLAFAAVALLAVAASATSLGNGFAYDDHLIIVENARVHRAGNALRLFAQTYWPPKDGEGLYRPLTMLGFLGQWLVGAGAPLVFHLVSVLAYAAASAAVLALALRLLPLPAAFVAAAVFAVHPVHVEAVGNVVGQSELWVALASVSATVLYLRLRTRQLAGEPAGRLGIAIVLLYAAACLSKEHGIVLPGLLVAAELTVVAASARLTGPRARLRQVAPLLVALAVVAVVYLVVRSSIVPGVLGDGPHHVLRGRPAATRFWTVLGLLGEWLRLLLWPSHLAAIYAPPGTPAFDRFAPVLLAPLLALAGLLALAVWAWRRRPTLAFGLAWLAIALLPTSNLLFPTGLLLAERTLFLPSVGFALVAGDAATWAIARARGAGPRAARLAGAALALVLALGVLRSADRQRVWKDNASLFTSAAMDEPLSYKAQHAYGGMLMTLGRRAEGERRLRFAMRLMPTDADVHVDLAVAYRKAGLCPAAIPLYREALRIDHRRPDARVDLVVCLLREARFEEARAESRRGLALGYQRPAFRRLLGVADSVILARAP